MHSLRPGACAPIVRLLTVWRRAQGGKADCAIAFRSLAQGRFARYGRSRLGAAAAADDDAFLAPYGLISPAQRSATKITRFMAEHGIRHEALRAIAMASYRRAQSNPRTVMRGRPLDEAKYDASRWIIEPVHRLFGCRQENGGAGAVQAYENFTGGVLLSLLEHGFADPRRANEELVLADLLAPSGRMPMNTSGGNLAECCMHGLEMVNEAVRQLRGDACNQVPGAEVAAVLAGPMVAPVSSLVLGTEAAL